MKSVFKSFRDGSKVWYHENGHQTYIDFHGRKFHYNEKSELHSVGNKPSFEGPSLSGYYLMKREWHLNGHIYKKVIQNETLRTTLRAEITKYDEFGEYHCLNGPAQIINYTNQPNSKFWEVNGHSHRINGPARIWSNGETEWFINLSISYDPVMDNA